MFVLYVIGLIMCSVIYYFIIGFGIIVGYYCFWVYCVYNVSVFF